MDESLSEFQEKKKKKSGPKSKPQATKKPIKKIKGQKDIRNLIKPKKNELVSYAKDFDGICKQSGIDVDPEQLQLAIALSKSLQETEFAPDKDQETTKPLTSQERSNAIKTTLQEYGFKVKQGSLIKHSTKRHKKKQKNYKLLSISDSERQQIISDKYSEVLLLSETFSKCINFVHIDNSENLLYHLTTSIVFKDMSNEIYYITDLFDKYENKVSLLKNWSEIPGRPVSPLFEGPNFSFLDVKHTSQDLDHILSGTIESTQRIIHNNLIVNQQNCESSMMEMFPKTNVVNENSSVDKEILMEEVPCENRSYSPDLFDDEVTIIMDNNFNKSEDTCRNLVDAMDLTECVNINDTSPKIDKVDLTQYKSNDFMEITNCVHTSKCVQIDLTQNIDVLEHFEKKSEIIEINESITEDVDETIQTDNIHQDEKRPRNANQHSNDNVVFDLTQSSNSSDELPDVKMDSGPNNLLEETVIVSDDYNNINNKESIVKSTIIDIELNRTFKSPEDQEEESSFKNNITSEITCSINVNKNKDFTLDCKEVRHISQVSNHSENKKDISIVPSENVDDRESSFLDILDSIRESTSESDEYDNVEMSQAFNSPNKHCHEQSVSTGNNYFELGKKDNVSIDYDDLTVKDTPNLNKSRQSNTESRSTTPKHNLKDKIYLNDFNYSINNYDNFHFGGISIMDNFTEDGRSTSKINSNGSLSDSFLPLVEVKDKHRPKHSQNVVSNAEIDERGSPIHVQSKIDNHTIKTPGNKEYIIKTDQVTPMCDYESMSSPERNKELEKYGLKPFRRKRAIQLLTYIYNQTHPFVDSAESPPKRQKISPSTSKAKAAKSPRKMLPLVEERNNFEGTDDIFVETNSVPVIKEVLCNPEDWVFQTREKAKIHSCRMPLHIAFHNHVTCRSRLQEAILLYQPIDIDRLHKLLVATGHRYNPKDLLKFMDKKCITVKTADKSNRNKL